MHHAHSSGGAGWCMFSDLTLALRKLRQGTHGMIHNILIIDTDAHQVGQPVLPLTSRNRDALALCDCQPSPPCIIWQWVCMCGALCDLPASAFQVALCTCLLMLVQYCRAMDMRGTS